MNEQFFYQPLTEPDRLEVRDAENNWLATFTLGTYTVTIHGPKRTFSEQDVSVTHTTWVRTLPAPFDGQLDADWLAKALAANQQRVPDILAIAMQYIQGAPALFDENGLQIAGDANYGPEKDGKRQEGADFNDYLGIPWKYQADGLDNPESEQFRCLDCSGFMRMVWGYRHNFSDSGYTDAIPLSLKIKPDSSTMPRRAWQICVAAPGIAIVPNTGVQVTDFSKLGIGDLVFFDASEDDGSDIDHVGMFMGLDAKSKHRFISSRKGINGPTLSDFNGKSVLEGTGLYARSFRAVRRL